MQRAMLATPAYDGRLDVAYTYSLLETIKLCAAHGVALHPVWWPGEALIQHARNMLVQIAVESKVDAVLFADSDQSWQPADALKLLAYPVHVVGAPVRKKSDDESWNVRSLTPHFPVDEQTGLWKANAIGTGFLRVSGEALQTVWARSKPYSKGGQQCRMVFDVPVIDGELWGEDTIFCSKLAECGYPIYVDPKMQVGHHGSKNYTGDFEAYVNSLQKASLRVVG